jgi:hypothetical protein
MTPRGWKAIGMPDEEVYECPECSTSITEANDECPGCGTELEWEIEEEDVDALLDDIEKSPAGEPPEVEDEPLEDLPVVEEGSVAEEPEVLEEEVEDEESYAPEEEYEEEAEEDFPLDEPVFISEGPKLFAGAFSKLGLAFLSLAIIAIIGTIILARYDTIIQGAAEESVGDQQRLYIYLGVVGIIVCGAIAGIDAMRNKGKATA